MSLSTAGLSEEYQKKMQEWEDKKRKNLTKGKDGGGETGPREFHSIRVRLFAANSFALESTLHDDLSPTPSKEDVKYSEDFIKKMEEWEAKKGLTGRYSMPAIHCVV
jgi:hypothetical protein